MKYLPQCSNRSVPRVLNCSLKKEEKIREKNKRKGREKKLELIKERKKPITHKIPTLMFELNHS